MAENQTVVCVHGFMRKGGNLSAVKRVLQKEGCAVVNWTYSSRKKTIEGHAQDLVEELKRLADGQPIHFVTHSMGGLLLRCALNHPECPIEAKQGRVVLIAPPNQGSCFARRLHRFSWIRAAVGNQAGEQLLTCENFDYLGDFPEGMPVLIIAGTLGINPLIGEAHDGKVAVAETRLNTPHVHMTVWAGHSWICHWPSTLQKVKRFILVRDV